MSTFPESAVSRALGVKKKHVAGARHAAKLEKGADWQLVNSVVHYTRTGLAKLCQRLGLSSAPLTLEKIGGGPAAPAAPAPARGPSAGPQDPVAGHQLPGLAADTVAATTVELQKKSGPVWIEVTARPANQVIVHGRLDGKAVTVRVKNNTNFVPGLWIQATPLNGGTYFAMTGNPPRWRGDRHGFAKPAETTLPPQTGGHGESSTGTTQSGPDPARAGKAVASAQPVAPTPTPSEGDDHGDDDIEADDDIPAGDEAAG